MKNHPHFFVSIFKRYVETQNLPEKFKTMFLKKMNRLQNDEPSLIRLIICKLPERKLEPSRRSLWINQASRQENLALKEEIKVLKNAKHLNNFR